jgi:hypothetical protein
MINALQLGEVYEQFKKNIMTAKEFIIKKYGSERFKANGQRISYIIPKLSIEKWLEAMDEYSKFCQVVVIKNEVAVCDWCCDYLDGDSDNITCDKCKRRLKL